MTSPTVVGINRTQDGSVAVTRGGATMYSLQKERISRRKHHWGRLGDLPKLYKGRMPLLDGPVDLVVEGWSSDAEFDRLEEYHAELRETLHLTPRHASCRSATMSLISTAPSTPRRST